MPRRRRTEERAILPHKHCKECGIAVPPERVFCSKECESAHNSRIKRRRRTDYMFIGIMAAILIFTVIIGYI